MQLGLCRLTEARAHHRISVPVLAVAFAMCLATTSAYAQGTVKVLNVNKPMTRLQAGDTARIQITGGAPNAQVKFSCTSPPGNGLCGTDPTIHNLEGMTDGFGNFTKDYPQPAGNVGSYEQHWYWNNGGGDVEVIPSNPDTTYITFAPTLPTFTVYSLFSGTNCALAAIDQSTCEPAPSPFVPHQWIWSPVTYTSNSTAISPTDVIAAVQSWTSIESKVPFSNDTSSRIDIQITDRNLGTAALGMTATYGEDCNTGCYDRRMVTCPAGACLNSNVVFFANIYLNPGEISNTATKYSDYMFATPAMVANMTMRHELGHALRLRHVDPTNGICSEVQDIMYTNPNSQFGCGVTVPNPPNSSCDTTAVDNVYPSAMANCGTGLLFCDASSMCQ